MNDFKQFRRSQIAELRPWVPGEDITKISVSMPDRNAGSPKTGDMIARNPANHDDQWLVAEEYFKTNFEPLDGPAAPTSTWQERVAAEYSELKSKLDALSSHLRNNVDDIEHHAANLLRRQEDAMRSYLSVLVERMHHHDIPLPGAETDDANSENI